MAMIKYDDLEAIAANNVSLIWMKFNKAVTLKIKFETKLKHINL